MKKISAVSIFLFFLFTFAFVSVYANESYADQYKNGDYKIKISEAFPDENLRNAISGYDWDQDGYLDKNERDNLTDLECTNVKSFVGIQELKSIQTVDLTVNDSNLIIVNNMYSHMYGLFDFANHIYKEKECSTEYIRSYPPNWIRLRISAEVPNTKVFVSNSDTIQDLEVNGSADLLSVSDCYYLNYINCGYSNVQDLSIIGCPSLSAVFTEGAPLDYLDLTNYYCGEDIWGYGWTYSSIGFKKPMFTDIYQNYENNTELKYHCIDYLTINPFGTGSYWVNTNNSNGSAYNSIEVSTNPSTNVVVYPVTLAVPVFPANAGIIYDTNNNPYEENYVLNDATVISAGTTCKLTAEANDGYNFKYWMCDNEILSTDPIIEYTINKNKNIVAVFESDNDDRILIDKNNFPDENFRKAVSEFDTNKDGYIDESEYLNADYLYCSNKNIRSLKGIELLPLIYDLNCAGNSLTELDLSHNTSLKNLNCSDNPIQDLNVDNNTMLEELYVDNISDLDLTIRNLPNLNVFSYERNTFNKFNVYNCMQIELLRPTITDYAYISGNVSLEGIDLIGKGSTTCVISGSPELTYIDYGNLDKLYPLGDLCILHYLTCNSDNHGSVNIHGCANWEWSTVYYANELSQPVFYLLWDTGVADYHEDPNDYFIDPININVVSNVEGADSTTGTFITERGGIAYLRAYDIPGYNFEKWVIKDYEVYNHEVYDRFVTDTTAYAYYSVNPDQIPINEISFPDTAFSTYVNTLDTNKNGSIDKDEISSITNINCSGKNISNLKGIEHFTNLKTLDCSNNNLTTIDLSALTELTTLDCSNNQLYSLDLSSNLSLTKLDCSKNAIEELNVVKNPNLVKAGLGKKTVTDDLTTYTQSTNTMTIDTSSVVWYDPVNVKVSSDNIEYGTTSMSVTVNSNEEFELIAYAKEHYHFVSWIEDGMSISTDECIKLIPGTDRNIIATFHIDEVEINNTNFPCNSLRTNVKKYDANQDNYLDSFEAETIRELKITSLDSLTGINLLTKLEKLEIDSTSITDYSSLMYVQKLDIHYAYGTQFKINGDTLINLNLYSDCELLDLSNTTKLEEISLIGNTKKIDLSNAKNLRKLDAQWIDSKELILDSCDNLEEICFPYGAKGNWDLSVFPSIKIVNCNGAQIQSINLSGCSNLIELYCEDTPISELNLSSCSSLETLNINNTNVGSISFANKDNLKHLYCKGITIDTLDLSGYTKLEEIDLKGSKISNLDLSSCSLIQVLNCESAGLTSLNLSNCSGLIELKCNDNQLSKLDLSACNALKSIDCSNNNIDSLKISCPEALEKLLCANNAIQTIDLNNYSLLRELICNGNNIDELSFPDSPYLIYASDKWNYDSVQNCYIYQTDTFNGDNIKITLTFDTNTTVLQTNGNVLPITKEVFPDNNFAEYIRNTFDIDRNGYLNNEELDSIVEINTGDGLFIYDCTGIEHFHNLEKLTLNVFVNKIDLSHLDKLKSLKVKCTMNTIDVSKNTSLEYLVCSGIGLTGLDLSNNTNLKYLDCSQNKISELSLKNNTKLEYLHCGSNNLSTLQISHLTHLNHLNCGSNKLPVLDLTGLSGLMSVSCGSNQLENLILPAYSSIETLNCSYNALPRLDLANIPDLKTMNCENNKSLSELILPDGNKLEEVYCQNCALRTLDLEGQTKLQHVNCNTNSIEQLKLDGCNMLKTLDCSYNRISSLILSSFENLEKLYCNNNQITQIDITGNRYLLTAYNEGDILSDRTIMNFSWRRNQNSIYTYILKYDEGVKIISVKVSPTPVATATPTPTAMPVPTSVATPTPTVTPIPTKPATPTPSSKATVTPVPTAAATPTNKPTATPTVVPTVKTDATPTATPTAEPTAAITPTSTPTPVPVEPKVEIESFIDRIYIYVLDRDPDKDGSAYWTDELYNFSRTGSEVAQGFIFSPEFINRNTSDREFIYILYKTFFGREPDEAGMNYWLEQLSSKTMDRATVANGFIYSQEWADTCAEYGIRSGGDTKPKVTIEPTELTYAFVERMYTTAMKREYDEEGRNYWATELANFNITGEAVGASFFLSEEMINYKLSDREYIDRLYQTFMDRKADTEGLNYWLGFLKEGHTREEVVYGFTRSPEFTEKCITARILPY